MPLWFIRNPSRLIFYASTAIFLIACHKVQSGITLHLRSKHFLIKAQTCSCSWLWVLLANAAVRSGPSHQHHLQTRHMPLHCRLHSFPDKIRAKGRRGVSRTLDSDVPHLHWCTDGRQRFTPLPGCFPLTAWQTGPVGFWPPQSLHSFGAVWNCSGDNTHKHTHHFLPTCVLPASARQNVKTGHITRSKREINIFPVTITTHPTGG